MGCRCATGAETEVEGGNVKEETRKINGEKLFPPLRGVGVKAPSQGRMIKRFLPPAYHV